MKKLIGILLVLCAVMNAALSENAAAETVYVRGEIRESLDMSEEQLSEVMNVAIQNGLTTKLYEVPVQAFLVPSADKDFRLVTKFFSSMNEMLMALDANLIDGACMPEFAGKYLLAHNEGLKAGKIEFGNTKENYYLGFYNNADLRDRANAALAEMKADGTLYALQEKYLTDFAADPAPVEFETFEGAETIRVAVTGDLPPLDYISEDGSPAGYNTALIAELGKRMRINIDILNIESSSRTLSLTAGVADVIFWYLYGENYVVTDMANGIQLSDPYYSLNNWFYIERKAP